MFKGFWSGLIKLIPSFLKELPPVLKSAISLLYLLVIVVMGVLAFLVSTDPDLVKQIPNLAVVLLALLGIVLSLVFLVGIVELLKDSKTRGFLKWVGLAAVIYGLGIGGWLLWDWALDQTRDKESIVEVQREKPTDKDQDPPSDDKKGPADSPSNLAPNGPTAKPQEPSVDTNTGTDRAQAQQFQMVEFRLPQRLIHATRHSTLKPEISFNGELKAVKHTLNGFETKMPVGEAVTVLLRWEGKPYEYTYMGFETTVIGGNWSY